MFVFVRCLLFNVRCCLGFVLHSRATALPLYHFENECQHFFYFPQKSRFIRQPWAFLDFFKYCITKKLKKFFKNFDILFETAKNIFFIYCGVPHKHHNTLFSAYFPGHISELTFIPFISHLNSVLLFRNYQILTIPIYSRKLYL